MRKSRPFVAFCKEHGVEAFKCTHWAEGGKGTEALAKHVAELADRSSVQFKPIYGDDMPLWDKIKTIAREIYRADDIVADKSVRDQLKGYEAQGYGKFPICMAKTQYSFSTDPNLKGAPTNHVVPIREVQAFGGCGVHRGGVRRHHDHAGPAQGAVGGGHRARCQGADRRAVLSPAETSSSLSRRRTWPLAPYFMLGHGSNGAQSGRQRDNMALPGFDHMPSVEITGARWSACRRAAIIATRAGKATVSAAFYVQKAAELTNSLALQQQK